MPMKFLCHWYATKELVEVVVDQGRVAQITSAVTTANATTPWLAPGLVDLQVNGYGGTEFSSPTATTNTVADVTEQMALFGVLRYLPTVTTATFAVMAQGLRNIAAACEQFPTVARAVGGIHLEGPYLSPEDGPRGAHPQACCKPPEWEEFQRLQDAAGGRIRLLTMAVEWENAARFIAQVVTSGVVVAIGHTAANSDQIRAAVDAGARLSTHLGNGSHRMLRRHPNYLWDQLAEDRLDASLIVDGQHLPPEVVKTFVRAKGAERCILVSDLSGLAGLPPGRYAGQLCDVEILADGRLVLAGQEQLLAGAGFPLGLGIENVQRFADVDLTTALQMAIDHPARLMGWSVPKLAVGARLDDFIRLDIDPKTGRITIGRWA